MTEYYTIKRQCLKGQRILQPGETRGIRRFVASMLVLAAGLVVATVAAAVVRAVTR